MRPRLLLQPVCCSWSCVGRSTARDFVLHMKRPSSLSLAARMCASIPFSFLDMVKSTRLFSFYYHVVSNEEVPHVKNLYAHKTIREFRDDLDFLLRHFAPISMAELLDLVNRGCPFPRKRFLLTFDDGFREMHDIVAPILIEKGVSATFFVNTAFIDNNEMCYLNKASLLVEKLDRARSTTLEQAITALLHSKGVMSQDARSGILSINYKGKSLLEEIADVMDVDFSSYLATNQPYLKAKQISSLIEDGFSIGAHSIDHPLYSSLSLAEQVNQTITSVSSIRNTFNLNYGVFAFPHGDNNVSQEYFTQVDSYGLIDLSFGTAGLLEDSAPRNIQRVNLENPRCPAETILSYNQARRLKHVLMGKAMIARA